MLIYSSGCSQVFTDFIIFRSNFYHCMDKSLIQMKMSFQRSLALKRTDGIQNHFGFFFFLLKSALIIILL